MEAPRSRRSSAATPTRAAATAAAAEPRPAAAVLALVRRSIQMNAENRRLQESAERRVNWKRWGPYLAERAWGTVREDYSADGSAWRYFPHDQARSRAYRWNEDGLAGICDRHQRICLAIALWNQRD